MTNIAADAPATFDPVYQIQTTDPVLGGPGGIANMQAQALVNRTAFLLAALLALPASAMPLMNSPAGQVGVSQQLALQDHAHPCDTSRASLAGAAFTGAVTGPSFNGVTGLATVAPLADGTAATGLSTLGARQDHVHPALAATSGQIVYGTGTATTTSAGLTYSASTGVGITTTIANAGATAQGLLSTVTITTTANNANATSGLSGVVSYSGANNLTAVSPSSGNVGLLGVLGSVNCANTAGTVSAIAGTISIATQTGAGTLSNMYGHVIAISKTAGTVTNAYGLYINAVTAGAASNFSIYTNAGLVNFGDTTACTGPLTGAFQVAGGAAIAGSLNIGGGSVPMNKYDEGVWTPPAWPGGGTVTNTSCKWIRTGNLVHCVMQIQGSGLTITANATWAACPFTNGPRESGGSISNTGMTQTGAVAISGTNIFFPAMGSTSILVINFDMYLV
jgi:hypothetical protein